ncbi:MAG: phenylalanine--tRNA ligase subunit alpha, partial [Desulfuromonadales bacterium]|nr:phenylalanine--tRNA ligase subunit alpha [Desulfuromonadales bacterium]
MKEKLLEIEKVAMQAAADVASEIDLQQVKARFLGRKGEVTAIMKGMGQLTPEERPAMGALVNEVKDRLESA